MSISSSEEHGFLVHQLLWQDPQHRRWYVGGRQQSPDYWVNDGDGTNMADLENAFFISTDYVSVQKEYLTYRFSNEIKRWGFEPVMGDEPLLYICEVPVTKLHYLVVDDRTHEYGIDVVDPEKVPVGPHFIKQPENIVYDTAKISTNSYVTLSCLANGYPTPTYEWFKEKPELVKSVFQKLDPLKNSKYTISGGSLIIHQPDQTLDRGNYHCKASNKYGSIISETVELAFGSIGEFNLKRSAESGQENWGKTMFCDPPPHYTDVKYYWARDYFPNFVEEDKRVFVSYDGALYFSALENIDKGNYSCNVQSKVSDTGRNGPFFHLNVISNSNFQQLKFPNNFPKAFPEAPVAGKEVRLECIVYGYPIPSYNWTRRGSVLPKQAQFQSYNRVLIIPNVQVEDQGEYVCRVYNDRSEIENSVHLTIQAEPNFTIPLTDKHLDNHGDLTWTCEAFGIPDVTYSWWKNGEPLDEDHLSDLDKERYIIQDNVLTIKYLDLERDPGMYQCQAKNVLKTALSSAQLRVLSFAPTFKKKPLEPETYAAEGGNITVICNPEAAPRPKFTWKKDNNVIGSGGRRRILDNGNLVISPVSRDDDGLYTCIAQNTYGSDESSGRLIIMKGPTLIEKLPPKITTTTGKNIYLYCSASSEEILDIAYIWTHNGMLIINSYHTNVKVKVEGGQLNIYNVTFSEAGEYECVVKTAVGKISTKTTLTVEGPPGPPGGVQVISTNTVSAVLQWTDGSDHGREVLYYQISGRTQYNQTWTILERSTRGREIDRYNGRKEASVSNLTPYSQYEFRVQAVNALGIGQPSLPSPKYSTLNDKPYKAPEKISGGGGKIGDLIITWEPMPPQHQNGPGIYYKIFWRRHNSSETEFQFEVLNHQGNVGVAVIRIPFEYYYTLYDIKVQAANNFGYGPESNITTIYSAEDMPQVAPQQVYALAYNSTAVNVTWKPIDNTREKVRGKLIGHRLKYWMSKNEESDAVYYLSRSTRPWALIKGLQPNTYYYVKVMAYNSAGEGPESERYLEKTFRNAPQKPPSSVNIFAIDPSTVRVVWRYVQPTNEEEPLIGFKVRVWEVDLDMSTANDTIIYVDSKLEAYVRNLSPGKTYNMRVLAFSNGGDGRMSSPAFTFKMGDDTILRSAASTCTYFASLVVSLLVIFFRPY